MSSDSPAGALIPRFGKVDQRKCVCARPACKELSKKYQLLKDIRGNYTQYPLTNSNIEVKDKVERLHLRHLRASSQNVATSGRRSRAGGIMETRNTTSQPTYDRKYVAWHHYHPALIKKFAMNKQKRRYDRPDMVPRDFVDKWIRQDKDNGYSDLEKHILDGLPCYIFVPSYPLAQAQTDVVSVEEWQRLEDEASSLEAKAAAIRNQRQARIAPRIAPPRSDTITSLQQELAVCKDVIALQDQRKRSNPVFSPSPARKKRAKKATGDDSLALGEVRTLTGSHGGLNRLSIASNEYHQQFPKAAKELLRLIQEFGNGCNHHCPEATSGAMGATVGLVLLDQRPY